MDLLKFLPRFVKVVLCLFCPLPKRTKLKFDLDFNACWSFYFELGVERVKVLNALGPLCGLKKNCAIGRYLFYGHISKLFRLVYQKGAKNATWHFNKLGPWANWMSGSLQSLIQHQKQLLWEFPLSNFYQFRPFTPKWNLRLLPSSLNFLNISGSFKCYRGGRKTFSRGKNRVE